MNQKPYRLLPLVNDSLSLFGHIVLPALKAMASSVSDIINLVIF